MNPPDLATLSNALLEARVQHYLEISWTTEDPAESYLRSVWLFSLGLFEEEASRLSVLALDRAREFFPRSVRRRFLDLLEREATKAHAELGDSSLPLPAGEGRGEGFPFTAGEGPTLQGGDLP